MNGKKLSEHIRGGRGSATWKYWTALTKDVSIYFRRKYCQATSFVWDGIIMR